jgi:hypothetical protein
MVVALAICMAFLEQPEFRGPVSGARYGRIIIEGNTDTPDRVILEHLDMRPGQKILFGQLQTARNRLYDCGAFMTNPWRDTGPTVVLLTNDLDEQFLDVLVRVEERPGNWLAFGMLELVEAMIILDPEYALDRWEWITQRACAEAAQNHKSGCPELPLPQPNR